MTQGPHDPRYGHPEGGPIPPQYYQPPPPKKKHRWRTFFIVAVVVGLGLIGLVSCLAKVASDLDATLDPKVLPSMPSTPGTSAPIKPKAKTFMAEDGTYLVPENIAPGTYRNGSDAKDCYAARLKGTSGEIDDIITNNVGPNQVLTIEKTDRAVQVRFCGPWVMVTP